MDVMHDLIEAVPLIESKLGYTFKNKAYLLLAFVHCSFINENRSVVEHNERLEFLGDSVLGLLISDYLYHQLPSVPEGDLSHYRSRLVEAGSCVRYVQKLDLATHLLLGKGERMNTEGKGRESILSDLFEAVIGAVYLDGGLKAARHFLLDNFGAEIEDILCTPIKNWKALFQEYAQKNYQCPPFYKVLESVGPDHSKQFSIAAMINNQEFGRGVGTSKKEAQQAAAADALARLTK